MEQNRIYLNDNWKFGETGSSDTVQVRLPHTTAVTPFHYFDEEIYQKNTTYTRTLLPQEDWREKHVLLTVEGAAHRSEVILNGQSLGNHNCGYTAYTVDLAPYLIWGQENVLEIRVDSSEKLNQPPFGRVIDYMTYGGLYREVYLEVRPKGYIKDVFYTTEKLESTGDFVNVHWTCRVTLENTKMPEENSQDTKGEPSIRQFLVNDEGMCIPLLTQTKEVEHQETVPNGMKELKAEAMVDVQEGTCHKMVYETRDVRPWNQDTPVLYELHTQVYADDKLLDERIDRVGFRVLDFTKDGLFLNGKKVKLRGLNRHQSFPYVGYAMPRSMQENDAEILKWELKVNAVRTSHYPQSHHFLNRCDELGLLVFTEIPGWQHIGDEAWKQQAVKNTEDMVLQYRNHPSIFLWGVRINESADDDALYSETNKVAHKLDSTRPTSGVRFIQKSHLLEDVYSYNDFSHDGTTAGCMNPKQVTTDLSKGYLISEFNGHMFPTKAFDCEDHRVEHMLRHARVMDAYYEKESIAGGFGWCMFDYNTHKDFGSGDRICYHGVMDMFRNPKLAAHLYAGQGGLSETNATQREQDEVVLEVSSAMDIGEHPACLMKDVYVITNADQVKAYKNGQYIGTFDRNNSPFKHLPSGPILIDDFIGDMIETGEGFSKKKATDIKKVLMAANKYGLSHLPVPILALAAKCILFYGMSMEDAVELYNKYVGNWGGEVTSYRFEAIKDGKVVKTVERTPVKEVHLTVDTSHTHLVEKDTYDVAAVRIRAISETGMQLPFYQGPLKLEVTGDMELIGPDVISLAGGMGGTYIKTKNDKTGEGMLRITGQQTEPVEIRFTLN